MASLSMGMTSCLGGDNNEEIGKVQYYMYNYVDDLANPGHSFITQSFTNYEVNFTKSLMTADVKTYLAGGYTASFTGANLPMTLANDGYHFSAQTITGNGSVATGFKGKYNPVLNTVAYDYVLNDQYHVYSVTGYVYEFTTATVTQPGKETFQTDKMGFMFAPDINKGVGRLTIANFSTSDVEDLSRVNYKDIPYTIVPGSGLMCKAAKVENEEGYKSNEIENLTIVVSNHGAKAHMEFDMDGKHVTLDGDMFYVDK